MLAGLAMMHLMLVLTLCVMMVESRRKVNRRKGSAAKRVLVPGPHLALVYMSCFAKLILGMKTIAIHGATWVGGNRRCVVMLS